MSYAYPEEGMWEDDEPVYKRGLPFRLETIKVSHPIYDPENVWEFLHQTKVWRDGTQTDLKIKDIKEKQYLFNILKWARDHEDSINFTLAMASNIGKAGEDVQDSVLEYPLFIRIQERYLKLAK